MNNMKPIIGRKYSRLVVLLVMVPALCLGVFADTWFNNYENAKKAVEKGEWNQAVEYLRAALAEKDKPALKAKTYGLRFVEYLPYYYLGLAYYRLRLYKEARGAFNLSLEHGTVEKKADLYGSLQQKLGDCREKLKPPVTSEKAKTPPATPPPVKTEKVTQTPTQEKAKEEGQKDIPAKPAADVKKEEQKPAVVDIGKTAVDKLMEEGSLLYRAGKYQDAKAKFSAVLQLQAGHRAALESIEKIASAVGVRDLNLGIARYFEGESSQSETYLRQAFQGLSGDAGHRSKLVVVYQFLAVVLIEKYYLAEEPTPGFLEEARQYIQKIREINPAFKLEEHYFSPKIARVFSAKE